MIFFHLCTFETLSLHPTAHWPTSDNPRNYTPLQTSDISLLSLCCRLPLSFFDISMFRFKGPPSK